MPDSLLFAAGGLRTFSPGVFSGAGACSAAIIIKPSSLSGYQWLLDRDGIAGNGALVGHNGGTLKVYDGDSDPNGPVLPAADEWYLVAVTKPAGTATPRGHIYRYSTTTWTHANFAGTQNQLAAWTVSVRFVDGSNPWAGNILVAGLWDSELSDATIETLTATLPDWVAAAPDEAWRFDTASAITPFVGIGSQLASGTETLDTGDAPAGWSDAVDDTEPPTDPAGLTATPVSSARINLDWGDSTDNVAVTSYRVERCTGAGCTDFAEIATPSTSSYNNLGLAPETLYRYRVRAKDAADNFSGYSSIAEAITEAASTAGTLRGLMDEMADTLLAVVGPAVGAETEFQVTGRMNPAPTPPSIDIYPGDPFRDTPTAGFQEIGGELLFTVRARVTTVDNIAGQDLLLRLMDDDDAISVAGTLMEDQTLNGLASSVFVEGNTGYTRYLDGGTESGGLLGCEWRVRVLRVQS